ncbi:MAG: ATP synthase F1 subunit delta [Bacteroidota bacterium]|nr:ATP synthase F1 subunit delta [Bacteroidota bacterium]
MSDLRAAYRYAKSLISLAEEKDVLETIHSDMLLFTKVVEENKAFPRILKNPIINHEKKLNILKSIFKDKVNPMTLAIFEIITRKNREAILPDIAKSFHHQYNVLNGIEEAKVITTFPIDAKMRQEFKNIVREKTGKQVELKEEINESLIGGYILKIGDLQIDESINSKLKELKLEFSKNPYVKEY